MTGPDSINRLESSLRDALAGELFAEAGRLLPLYAQAAGQQLETMEPGSPAMREFHARVNGFFEWAELRTNTCRACAVTEMARLHSLSTYGRQPAFTHLDAS